MTAVAEDKQRAERGDIYNSFGSAWMKAFELAAAPPIFGVAGWFLDRRLGWTPVLTILFVVYATIGGFVRLYYQYKLESEAEDANTPWGRSRSTEASQP